MRDQPHRRLALAATLLLAVLSPLHGPRLGLAVADKVQKACSADYIKYCNPLNPGATNLLNPSPTVHVQKGCLHQYWTNLTPSCRGALQAGAGAGAGDDSDDSGDDN